MEEVEGVIARARARGLDDSRLLELIELAGAEGDAFVSDFRRRINLLETPSPHSIENGEERELAWCAGCVAEPDAPLRRAGDCDRHRHLEQGWDPS